MTVPCSSNSEVPLESPLFSREKRRVGVVLKLVKRSCFVGRHRCNPQRRDEPFISDWRRSCEVKILNDFWIPCIETTVSQVGPTPCRVYLLYTGGR